MKARVAGILLGLTAPVIAVADDNSALRVTEGLLVTWDCAITQNDMPQLVAETGLSDAAFNQALRDLMARNEIVLGEDQVYRLKNEECV